MSGVSIGPTNPDIDLILEGGEAFIERMRAFEAAAKQAQEAKAEAAKLLDAANKQFAENCLAAEQLAADREAVAKLQATLSARLATIDEIMRQ